MDPAPLSMFIASSKACSRDCCGNATRTAWLNQVLGLTSQKSALLYILPGSDFTFKRHALLAKLSCLIKLMTAEELAQLSADDNIFEKLHSYTSNCLSLYILGSVHAGAGVIVEVDLLQLLALPVVLQALLGSEGINVCWEASLPESNQVQLENVTENSLLDAAAQSCICCDLDSDVLCGPIAAS